MLAPFTKLNRANPLNFIRSVFDGLDSNMSRIFMPWIIRNPRYIKSGIQLARAYQRSVVLRKESMGKGVRVPPFMILSITSSCNLRCVGCYAAAVGTLDIRQNISCTSRSRTISWDDWKKIIEEARNLGVFSFIIAGGEPFLFPGLIGLCEEFKDSFFIILTNGTTVSEQDYKRLRKTTNIGIIVSVEGDEETTDARRGIGVHRQALKTLGKLRDLGIPTGISVTITRENFRFWMRKTNLEFFEKSGVVVGAFIEYIPIMHENLTGQGPKDSGLMLTPEERKEFRAKVLEYRRSKSVYLIHSPGDEDYFGGCVSAGRGFAHITPTGDLTACPVSNLATHNLTLSTLYDGLASPLFSAIRNNEHLLENEDSPCALFSHSDELQTIANEVGAYITDGSKE